MLFFGMLNRFSYSEDRIRYDRLGRREKEGEGGEQREKGGEQEGVTDLPSHNGFHNAILWDVKSLLML